MTVENSGVVSGVCVLQLLLALISFFRDRDFQVATSGGGLLKMQSLNHLPVLQLLSKINSKQISVAALSARARQNVIEHLIGQGYSVAEMASMLNVSDRTIVRDKRIIRGRNAIFSDEVGFTPRIVGMMVKHLDDSLGRLKRIGRDEKTKQRDRIGAERAMAYVFNTFAKRLQSVGYMPRAAMQKMGKAFEPAPTRLCEPATKEAVAMREVITERDVSSSLAGAIENFPQEISRSTEWEARTGMSRNDRRRWRKIERKAAKLVSAGVVVGPGI